MEKAGIVKQGNSKLDKMKNRFLEILAGDERGGKTFYAKTLMDAYFKTMGSVLVYGVGKPEDFPDGEYEWFEPLTFAEHLQFFHSSTYSKRLYNLNKTIEYFRFRDKVYHFRDFNRLFYKRHKLKMYRIPNRAFESAFLKAMYEYTSGCLMGFDDCRSIFRYGLQDTHIEFFSRKNHSGAKSSTEILRGKGIDSLVIYHNVDHVSEDFWTYGTSFTMFRCSNAPDLKKVENRELEKSILETHAFLETAPQYTAVSIPLKGENRYKKIDSTIKIKSND